MLTKKSRKCLVNTTPYLIIYFLPHSFSTDELKSHMRRVEPVLINLSWPVNLNWLVIPKGQYNRTKFFLHKLKTSQVH